MHNVKLMKLIHLRPKYDMPAHWPRPHSLNINYPEWGKLVSMGTQNAAVTMVSHIHTYKQTSDLFMMMPTNQPSTLDI
jgi:hypothetical protein